MKKSQLSIEQIDELLDRLERLSDDVLAKIDMLNTRTHEIEEHIEKLEKDKIPEIEDKIVKSKVDKDDMKALFERLTKIENEDVPYINSAIDQNAEILQETKNLVFNQQKETQ